MSKFNSVKAEAEAFENDPYASKYARNSAAWDAVWFRGGEAVKQIRQGSASDRKVASLRTPETA